MVWVVGVRFKPAGKIYHFACADLELKKDEPVIVETVRGIEYGTVAIESGKVAKNSLLQPLRSVIRQATPEDIRTLEKNKKKGQEALAICKKKIREHHLPMRLIDAEYTFDRGKISFYFTAEGRVDFRELVKDLASVFKTRIELRQIGVRDEAKILGGIGACGRVLCCNCFLGEFEPVSIRMAKEQNLSLNPTKISGICGRLMCCLKYESELYEGKENGETRNGQNAARTKKSDPRTDSGDGTA